MARLSSKHRNNLITSEVSSIVSIQQLLTVIYHLQRLHTTIKCYYHKLDDRLMSIIHNLVVSLMMGTKRKQRYNEMSIMTK